MAITKNQKVESGKILDTIKQISDKLFGVVDKLIDFGLSSDDVETKGKTTTCKNVPIADTDQKATVSFTEVKEGKFDVTIKYGSRQLNKKNVDESGLNDLINEMLKAASDEIKKQVKSSIHMNVTFKRIIGSTEDSIEVKSINCSDDPGTALMVIDNVLADPSIQDEIEDEASYDISMDENEEISVAECDPEECEGNPLVEMLLAAYKFDNIGMTLFYNAKGDKFQQIRNMTENWGLRYQIQTMSEWMVEIYGSCPSPSHFYQSIESLGSENGYSYEDALPIYQAALNDYISALKLHTCCLDEVKSQTVFNWLQDLDHNANYVIERTTL